MASQNLALARLLAVLLGLATLRIAHCNTVIDDADLLISWRDSLEGFQADGILSTWNTSSSPCTAWQGIRCQGGSRITDIALDSQAIRGTVPQEFSALGHLLTVSLKFNSFTGDALPQEWSVLERLVLLNLADNELTGTLPNDMSPFTLQYLHMSNNRLHGPLPDNLAGLQYISLESNRLTGSLKSWSGSEVVSLKLPDNIIRGGIPEEWENMTSLKYLELQDNLLYGTLSAALTPTLAGLEVLSIGDNALEEQSVLALADLQPDGAQWSLLPQRPWLAPEPVPKMTKDPETSTARLFEEQGKAPVVVDNDKGLDQWVIFVIVGVSCIVIIGGGIATAVYFTCYGIKQRTLSTKVDKFGDGDLLQPEDPPSNCTSDAALEDDLEDGLGKEITPQHTLHVEAEAMAVIGSPTSDSRAYDVPPSLPLSIQHNPNADSPPKSPTRPSQPVPPSPKKLSRSSSTTIASASLSRSQSGALEEPPSDPPPPVMVAVPPLVSGKLPPLDKLPPLRAHRNAAAPQAMDLPALEAPMVYQTSPPAIPEARGLNKPRPSSQKPLAMYHPEDDESEMLLEPRLNRRRSSGTQDAGATPTLSSGDMKEEDIVDDDLATHPSQFGRLLAAQPPEYESGVLRPSDPLLGNFFRNEASHEVVPPSNYFGAPRGSLDANDVNAYSSASSSRAPSSAGSGNNRWLVAAPTQRVASSSSALQKPVRGNSARAGSASAGRPPRPSNEGSARPRTSTEGPQLSSVRLSDDGRPPLKRAASAQGARSEANQKTASGAADEGQQANYLSPSKGKQLTRSRSSKD